MASSSKATSRRSKAETKGSKSTVKAKGRTKAKAAVEGEDVEMHDGDKESDPPEEDNDSGEEELEDVEERKAASKRCVFKFLYFHCPFLLPAFLYAELSFHSAQVALDRRDEMDVEGWKVGDPYVQSLSIGWCVDILLVYPMLRSQKHLHSSRRLRSG